MEKSPNPNPPNPNPNPAPSKSWIPYAIGGTGAIAMIAGMFVSAQVKSGTNPSDFFSNTKLPNPMANFGQPSVGSSSNQVGKASPVIAPLTKQSPQQRAATLKQVAATPQPSLDRSRARYVLANDLLAAKQPAEALKQLDNLEKDYAVLGPKILQKRAIAQTALNQTDAATQTWQSLVQQYPKDPTTAEALFELGQREISAAAKPEANPKKTGKPGATQSPQPAAPAAAKSAANQSAASLTSKYWDQAIAQFPSHPRTLAIAKTRLKQNPKQLALQLLVVKAETDSKDTPERLDQIVQTFGPQLRPQDWETIAFAYWESQKYDKGADAYARSPQTPLTAYRAARGLHLSGKPGGKQRYQAVVQNFPGTPEAGLALTRLAQVVEPKEAPAYLDQVIANYPDRAPQALLDKAKILDQLKSGDSATQVRQYLLTKYATTDAAAELRWIMAQERAKAGDAKAARQWAEEALTQNSNSEIAAKAGFWAGKWAMTLGDAKGASGIFQKVIKEHPESYYAWRSASILGWNVGDFTTVRNLQPSIQQPKVRPSLLAGSPALRELQQMGQDQDAWAYWQVEHQNRVQPTVAEQFTDGILRLGVGDNLDGIYMVSNLADRDKPEDKQQYAALKQQKDYWQGLYPFPFESQIANWSQQRRLNPMLVTALIRQESRFEPQIQSSVGAAGLMQVMPETAEFIASKIQAKTYNLKDPEDSIKLGTWYLDHTHDEYDGNSMLAVASYNAGPGAVSEWLTSSKTRDPDEFVEAIPYDETKGYVKSVFANYWNYLRLYNPEIAQRMTQASPEQPKTGA
jgi:soluble lytic murein transglycosylase